ncbi:MAG TPA: hypothetical protein VMN58_10015, partial [Acidimicrobiales bacterium]|nr:hypothetical protein [Acidimicrobiales bacterium]
ALRWRKVAVERSPSSPHLWNQLALDEEAAGLMEDAFDHYRTALRWNPWSRIALRGVVRTGTALGRPDMVSEARQRLRQLPKIDDDCDANDRTLVGSIDC